MKDYQKNKVRKRNICFFALTIIFLFFCFLVFLSPSPVLAQDANELLWGGKQGIIGSAIGLGDEDPRIIAAKIIRVFLGFLGIIAFGLIVYAGWLWMTSEGNEEKIEQSKKILKNAAIGLLIILASFGIVSFIINKLYGGGGGLGEGEGPPGGETGFSAIGSCTVESVYPEPGQKEVPRNTIVIVTFKEEVDPNTVCNNETAKGGNGNDVCDNNEKIIPENVRIFKTSDGDSCTTTCPPGNTNITDVTAISTDNKNFVFIFTNYLGSPSEYIWHSVHLTNDIEKMDKTGVNDGIFATCHTDYLEWQFEVSNLIDLTPPKVLNVFPAPDDAQDVTTPGVTERATGKITVNSQPNYYVAAEVNTVTAGGGSPQATAVIDPNNKESEDLKVTVSDDGITTQLSKGAILLGAEAFSNNSVTFAGYFTLTVTGEISAGNEWTVNVSPEQEADTLTVGSITYTFVSGSAGANEIQVGATENNTAENIQSKIDDRSDLIATVASDAVNLTAEIAGTAGNNIQLSTSNTIALGIALMSGGEGSESFITINGKADKPRNAVIKINFNEAVNPLTVSGNAEDVKDYIRVVNGGQNLTGSFAISNQYRTVEFISDDLCGVNACGENIYCLPENSNLRVDLVAASLADCGTDICASRSPYSTCVSSICQDSDGDKYPLSKIPFNGIMDAALNSLDGNRDDDADGPVTFYNQNNPDPLTGDNYQWSFWISDVIDLTTPVITATNPEHAGPGGAPLINPVTAGFDKIMMSSSLRTGQVSVFNGKEYVTHKRINIWNFGGSPIGYWITQTDIDEPPPNGEIDYTQAEIRHSMFADSTSYRSQIGSGVKDIYQNCFKPGSGPACPPANPVTETEPSCCSGTPEDVPAGENCP